MIGTVLIPYVYDISSCGPPLGRTAGPMPSVTSRFWDRAVKAALSARVMVRVPSALPGSDERLQRVSQASLTNMVMAISVQSEVVVAMWIYS